MLGQRSAASRIGLSGYQVVMPVGTDYMFDSILDPGQVPEIKGVMKYIHLLPICDMC